MIITSRGTGHLDAHAAGEKVPIITLALIQRAVAVEDQGGVDATVRGGIGVHGSPGRVIGEGEIVGAQPEVFQVGQQPDARGKGSSQDVVIEGAEEKKG